MSNRPSIEMPAVQRPSLMPTGERKSSFFAAKTSFSDDGKAHLKTLLHSPPPCKTRAMTPLGQLLLCIFGAIVSLAICVWLAIAWHHEPWWKRALFSGGAGLCALFFLLLAYTSKRRISHPPVPEPLPDLSQRRSTIGQNRPSKRSIAHSGSGDHGQPTQVLVVNEIRPE